MQKQIKMVAVLARSYRLFISFVMNLKFIENLPCEYFVCVKKGIPICIFLPSFQIVFIPNLSVDNAIF